MKGIGTIYTSKTPKILPLDKEVLEYFAKQLSVTILSRLEWFHGIKFEKLPTLLFKLDDLNL